MEPNRKENSPAALSTAVPSEANEYGRYGHEIPRTAIESHPSAVDEGLFSNPRPQMNSPARPICSLAIDAEEDFDWDRPVQNTSYTTEYMRHIGDLREIVCAYGLRPTYLLTYPVLENSDVVSIIRRQHQRGECDMGIQLHPWVTPPFDETSGPVSYLGNLDSGVEERKLVNLISKFREAFGVAPVTFRAGRYGLSRSTTSLLERYEFTVDTSLAPRSDFRLSGGPDFSTYECNPFWFGRNRMLLELPLCRSVIGWSGGLASILYEAAAQPSRAPWHLKSVLSRIRCAERITLSPEGNDYDAMRRFLRQRRRQGQSVFSLSFHSSSLWPGRNPYVRTRHDLHVFYDRLSAVLDYMTNTGVAFATIAEVPALVGGAP